MAIPLLDQVFPTRNLYKDFDINFMPHPLTGDVGVKTDAAAVKQSIQNLVLTNFYERPFQPTIGSNVNRLLFEPADAIVIGDLRQAITEVVSNYEPRATIKGVIVIDNSAQNSYIVTVAFALAGIYENQQVQVVLQRAR